MGCGGVGGRRTYRDLLLLVVVHVCLLAWLWAWGAWVCGCGCVGSRQAWNKGGGGGGGGVGGGSRSVASISPSFSSPSKDSERPPPPHQAQRIQLGKVGRTTGTPLVRHRGCGHACNEAKSSLSSPPPSSLKIASARRQKSDEGRVCSGAPLYPPTHHGQGLGHRGTLTAAAVAGA